MGAGRKRPFNYSPAGDSGAGGAGMSLGSCAMPCCAVPCRAIPCRAIPCCAVPCHAKLCHSVGSLGYSQLSLVFLLPRRRAAVSSTHAPRGCSRAPSPAPCPPRCLHSRLSRLPGNLFSREGGPCELRSRSVPPASDNRAFVLPGCQRGRREFGCPQSCREPFLATIKHLLQESK